MRRRPGTLLALALLAGASACSSPTPTGPGTARPSSPATASPKYVTLADAIVAKKRDVWVESDLLKAYLAGPDQYARALGISLDLAARPGVLGIKIADELGYRDGSTPDQAEAFLVQSGRDIRARNPKLKILIDMVVPGLGCLSWLTTGVTDAEASCGKTSDDKDPGASLASVDRYLATGAVDVFDLSPGLRTDDWYARQGTTRDEAMTMSWQEAVRRWGPRTELHARKALAHPGTYAGGAAQAEADVHTFVDIPLANGAKAVDVWTWCQMYQGQVVGLTDPGIQSNALTDALQARRKKGAKLWTHMTPSTLQVGMSEDVAGVTAQFDAVFVASGAG